MKFDIDCDVIFMFLIILQLLLIILQLHSYWVLTSVTGGVPPCREERTGHE